MVIDSSIFIEHLRAKDKTSTSFYTLPDEGPFYVSDITAFELLMGATDPKKRKDVENIIDAMIRLPFNYAIAEESANIYLNLKKRGMMIGFRDIFIAATARFHNLPIKTLNTKDFVRIEGLTLI